MNWIIWVLIILLFLAGVLFAWRRGGNELLKKARLARTANKEKSKAEILAYIQEKGRITNDDAQNLLGVSDSTATRLLEELQRGGKVVQHGETGKGVFYT